MDELRQVMGDVSRQWASLRYPSLDQSGGADDGDSKTSKMSFRRILRLPAKRLLTLVLVTLLLLFGLVKLFGPPSSPGIITVEADGSSHTQQDGLQSVSSRDQRFVIVLPADRPSPDLCKVITSALALGYPIPIIVNWGLDARATFGPMGSAQLARATGTMVYLDEATSDEANAEDRLRDDDIVLIVDAYNVWFQLPPEVLLRRYHEANRQANARLAKQWTGSGDMPMKQTIIFSSQKTCYPPPDSGSNVHCDALPDSPLRKDLYGLRTDLDPNIPHNVRPKFMNSGTIMGPVGDLKRYFRRVMHRMDKMLADASARVYSDQGIFGEVFGEQEIYRQWLRGQRPSYMAGMSRDNPMSFMTEEFEYHVGLDYGQVLSATTAFAEDDGDFLLLSGQSAIEISSYEHNVWPPRLSGVPDDLKDVRNPVDHPFVKQIITSYDWEEFPLYADYFTSSVPVMIDNNAHKYGSPDNRGSWWDSTWFFPYLRDLVTKHITIADSSPLATVTTGDGEEVVYWPLDSDKSSSSPRTFQQYRNRGGFQAASFDELCMDKGRKGRSWHEEVFRDGQGSV